MERAAEGKRMVPSQPFLASDFLKKKISPIIKIADIKLCNNSFRITLFPLKPKFFRNSNDGTPPSAGPILGVGRSGMNRADKPESPMGHRFPNTKEGESVLTERAEEQNLTQKAKIKKKTANFNREVRTKYKLTPEERHSDKAGGVRLQGAAWAGCTYAGARISTYLPFSVARAT